MQKQVVTQRERIHASAQAWNAIAKMRASSEAEQRLREMLLALAPFMGLPVDFDHCRSRLCGCVWTPEEPGLFSARMPGRASIAQLKQLPPDVEYRHSGLGSGDAVVLVGYAKMPLAATPRSEKFWMRINRDVEALWTGERKVSVVAEAEVRKRFDAEYTIRQKAVESAKTPETKKQAIAGVEDFHAHNVRMEENKPTRADLEFYGIETVYVELGD